MSEEIAEYIKLLYEMSRKMGWKFNRKTQKLEPNDV